MRMKSIALHALDGPHHRLELDMTLPYCAVEWQVAGQAWASLAVTCKQIMAYITDWIQDGGDSLLDCLVRKELCSNSHFVRTCCRFYVDVCPFCADSPFRT